MRFQWPLRRDPPAVEAKGLTLTPQSAAFEFPFGARAPGSNFDYAAATYNGMMSSAVVAAIAWMMRTLPEAPLVVQRLVDERWETIPDHPIVRLLNRSSEYCSGKLLLADTTKDFAFGEAFWRKIRNGNGDVVELEWMPRAKTTPMPRVADPWELDYYAYRPIGGRLFELKPDDVVHFRFGRDANNPLRGFAPLAAAMREVYIDDQAAEFTAAILKNLGIMGVIFSPKEGMIPKEEAERLKSYIQANFTGENRAKGMMFNGATTAQLLQYNLQGFDVGPIRDVVEERISAITGIPAAVIGFGTGLQQTKVGATMREMVKLAWQGCIEPNQSFMADELNRSLLPEFQANPALFRMHFDTSQVEALTETPREKTDRVAILVEKNIIKVSQAQRELGYPVDDTQDKYLRELTPAPASGSPVTLRDPQTIDPVPAEAVPND